MSGPRNQVRVVRGTLVGACSAIAATGAHAGAGGQLPHGGALAVAILICATVGAAAGSMTLEGRFTRMVGVVVSLAAAQSLSHVGLVLAGGHHHSGGAEWTPSMVASHAAAAVVLGVAIAAAEYLYAVCASVLCWLRLFTIRASRRGSVSARRTPYRVFAQSFWATSGLSMRAPPAGASATA